MKRLLLALVVIAPLAACCGEGEKINVPPLPQDGAALPYQQVLARLSAQTNAAKEDHFLNRWDGLVDSSVTLEQSASYITRSPDLPPAHRALIEKSAGEMKTSIVKLREAARQKNETESLELIRRLHNQVRDLQDLK
jgi:hypothetical protein